ncbi:MAG: UDP-3-O-acyl-N-acetylglucosamine deacetylase [Alphaproteobacteria bacterium]|nr:UDP-3-O-acyl-N-acetylglucosamine deacetylase [Alphaproteobacteria bacterium]OIN87686.1 MAG: UDP-3-O-[3-hydroxymyristoyl] N-acetylglucosamine deacetylase [Alphaproteobacteria bacterium CG1_02_46_17]
MQHTISNNVILSGVGLHSGAETILKIKSAPISSGLVFVRVDVAGKNNKIPAKWDHVVDTRLCTVVGNKDGVTVGTIEHLMAALAACGVDNAVIELDGPEVPIMDGSAEPFIEAILEVGLKAQAAPRRGIKILKEVSVRDGDKVVTLKPGIGSRYQIEIDFPHPEIGRQSAQIDMFSGDFINQIAEARTFGFLHEVNALRAMGLALGGSLENAIVLDADSVMNPEGLRCPNEFARHKVLDAVGDLYIAGGPIVGQMEASKPGHNMNNLVLRELFSQPDAWAFVDLYMDQLSEADLPVMSCPSEASIQKVAVRA